MMTLIMTTMIMSCGDVGDNGSRRQRRLWQMDDNDGWREVVMGNCTVSSHAVLFSVCVQLPAGRPAAGSVVQQQPRAAYIQRLCSGRQQGLRQQRFGPPPPSPSPPPPPDDPSPPLPPAAAPTAAPAATAAATAAAVSATASGDTAATAAAVGAVAEHDVL